MHFLAESIWKNIGMIILPALIIAGCAGPNPNPGERTTDMAWSTGNFERAFRETKPRAEAGEPWAQLRLGIFYDNGWGVEKNTNKAAEWYQKALKQNATGDWAEGRMIGAIGRQGFFNQNSDARIAEFNLAQLYYRGNGVEKNLVLASFHVMHVIEESGGREIFFCCEFAGGRYFSPHQFHELKDQIKNEMRSDQLQEAEELLSNAHTTPSPSDK